MENLQEYFLFIRNSKEILECLKITVILNDHITDCIKVLDYLGEKLQAEEIESKKHDPDEVELFTQGFDYLQMQLGILSDYYNTQFMKKTEYLKKYEFIFLLGMYAEDINSFLTYNQKMTPEISQRIDQFFLDAHDVISNLKDFVLDDFNNKVDDLMLETNSCPERFIPTMDLFNFLVEDYELE